MRRGVIICGATLALACASPAVAASPCGAWPWCNSSLSPDQRAGLLLSALTQDERLALLAGVQSHGHTGQTAAVGRLGVRSALITDDGVAVKQGTSTALPIPLAVAATFDRRMAALAGTVIAEEARDKGNDVLLGPTVNIMRTPLGGRAFEAAVIEAHAGTVMCAYNRVNDDWACEHRHLLTDILKREWGFQGAVVSDWQSEHETALALRNGLDVEMPTAFDYTPSLVTAALTTGLVTQAEVDDHVRRLLRTLFAFGFFDRAPYADDDRRIDGAGHARAAQRLEEQAITLLQDKGALPLDARRVHSIALLGPQADRFENGGGADDVTPFTVSTPRRAIAARAGPGARVAYDDGSDAGRAAAVAHAA